MKRKTTFAPLLAALMLASALGVLAWAAPLMPARRTLPDSWMSLAGNKALVFQVSPVPHGLVEAGITQEWVDARWRQKLRDGGFHLVADDPDAPALQLVILSGTEADLPDVVLTVMYLTLTQPARFDHLNMVLRVPTYTHPVGSMEPRANLGRSVRGDLDKMIDRFIERSRLADEELATRQGLQDK